MKSWRGMEGRVLIRAHYAVGVGGLTGRFNILCIHFVQQVEIINDGGKLVAEGLGLFFQDAQTHEERHVFDHIGVDGKVSFGRFLMVSYSISL